MRQPVRRIGRIKRHISGPGFQGTKRTDQQIHPPRGTERHWHPRPRPHLTQQMGQLVGASV